MMTSFRYAGFRVFGSFSCVYSYICVCALGDVGGDVESVCGGLWSVNEGDIGGGSGDVDGVTRGLSGVSGREVG